MKRLIIVLLVIVLIVGVGYFLYSQFLGSASSPASTTNRTGQGSGDEDEIHYVVDSCFTWYLLEYVAERSPSLARTDSQEATRCFTRNFLNSWKTDDSGADPVLLVQDYYDSWPQNLSAEVLLLTEFDSDVLVTFGTGEQQARVVAHLVQEKGAWRIDSSSLP